MKNNCNIVKDLIPLYIDDVCSDETKKLVEEHLKTCKECKKYFEDLKINIKTSKKDEVKVFKNFAKKINFKIFRNAVIITCLIIALAIPCLRFYGSYEFIMDYDDEMDILLLGNEKKWNFQFDTPISGYNYSKVVSFNENGKVINYIFVTHKYTPQGYHEAKKGNIAGSGLEIDYESISLKDKMLVYYTTEDLDKITNASQEELDNIINNSTLIFNNEEITTTMNCTLNNQDYSYTLTYYEVNKQIIESSGDTNMPEELLMDIYSIDGDYKSLWFTGDKANEIFEETEKYMTNKGGTCSLENKEN